jgi:transcriptional regulator with XRE-family HTH domain
MVTPDIGQQIKRIRRERGISQLDLFVLTGHSLVTISNIETGKTNPRLSTLQQIAEALGTTLTIDFVEVDKC